MEQKLITIDEFSQIELKVAEIISCDKVENADRLLRLKVSAGGEERQLVAGIAAHYLPEELIGKQVIVVWNLKPAVIRGVESSGMLLAARDGETLGVLTVDRKVKNGTRVS